MNLLTRDGERLQLIASELIWEHVLYMERNERLSMSTSGPLPVLAIFPVFLLMVEELRTYLAVPETTLALTLI